MHGTLLKTGHGLTTNIRSKIGMQLWVQQSWLFKGSVWERRKDFYMARGQYALPNRTIPIQSAWSMALSAMMVECVVNGTECYDGCVCGQWH